MSKGLEALKHLEDKFRTSSWAKEMDFTCACFEIEKSLKALEIIKEKRVSIDLLLICFETKKPVKYYNESLLAYNSGKLTQDEFDLLKEILKWTH